LLFEIVHANVDAHFVIAQKKPPAIGEPGMRKCGKHGRVLVIQIDY
jgi:hypothetical protein